MSLSQDLKHALFLGGAFKRVRLFLRTAEELASQGITARPGS